MFSCENKKKGCGQWFESSYGLRVHLRSCSYRSYGNSKHSSFNLRNTTSANVDLAGSGQKPNLFDVNENKLHEQDNFEDFVCDVSNNFSDLNSSKEMSREETLERLLMLRLERLGRKTSRKDVNDVISLLVNPSFHITSFSSRCRNYTDCMNEKQRQTQNSLTKLGFEKVELVDPESKYGCLIYRRSPVRVLQGQIRESSSPSTIFNRHSHESHESFTHPMTSELGNTGVEAVRNAIMSHTERGVFWHDTDTSFESSFVGLVQIYSDKSQNSLKSSSFQFYPLHITLLNFSDEYRKKCIVAGKTFVAFLPVSFFRNQEGNNYNMERRTFGRKQRLRMLHLAIDYILDELKTVAFCGFRCLDKLQIHRRCHPCIASYCCDLPESKDLISVRNGNQGTRNCHRCKAKTADFNKFTNSQPRTGAETWSIITRAATMRKNGNSATADALLKEFSLTEQMPIFVNFPFMGLHRSLDPHAILWFEPLHGFHLGVSKELKRCAAERLRTETIMTSSVPLRSGTKRTTSLKNVRMSILNGVNKMLSHIQSTSPARSMRIDFSKRDKGMNGNGLYNAEGKLIGMLEANDYKSIDKVSPFMGMYFDRCSDETDEAPTTSVFVQYVDIMQMAMSYDTCTSWTESRIQEIERRIRKFKNDTRELYGKFHPSSLSTEKFHMLDHIAQDLRRSGGLRFGDAGLYEYSHTLVKKAYRSGSKRKANSMDETVALFEREMTGNNEEMFRATHMRHDVPQDNRRRKRRKLNIEAIKSDCAVLVDKGRTVPLVEFGKARSHLRKLRKAKEEGACHESERLEELMGNLDENAKQLVMDIGEEGSRVLHKQLLEVFNGGKDLNVHPSDFTFTRVASCHVPGIRTPTLKDYNLKRKDIIVPDSSYRQSQRIVSERNFHGVSGLRQDCILIEGGSDSSTETCLWVGKALALLKTMKRNLQPVDQERNGAEYVFVQYFNATPPQDKIDKTLRCIRLQWAREDPFEDGSSRKEKGFQPGKWFDLLPVSVIRGSVQVVRGDYGKEGICVTRNAENIPWHEQFFYVNRFYFEAE